MTGKSLFFAALLVATSVVQAERAPDQPKPVFNEKAAPAQLDELIEMIRTEIKPGGRWEHVPEMQRPTLESELAKMESLLEGHESVDELSDVNKTRLMNAQSKANAILTRHDGERLICERHKPTGSHRTQTICITYAQRHRMRENSQDALLRAQSGRALPQKN